MGFDNEKKVFLSKIDKSQVGAIDRGIRLLVDLINSSKDYYTTSSCSGRNVLIVTNPRKDKAKWLFKSHDKISFEEIKKALADLPDGEVWLMHEPPILHVCCRTIGGAQKLINISKESGFKRPAILSCSKKTVVEIISTERIDVPVASGRKLLAGEEHLRFLAGSCNEKLENGRKKIEKLHNNIKKELKK